MDAGALQLMFARRKGPTKVPAVSVIIAAYGRPEALHRTLRSVERQQFQDREVLVVCDNVDPAFLEAIDRSDRRVRVLNLCRRAGGQYGPNSVGIRHARGDWIAFLNHDDLWCDDHLSRALAVMHDASSEFHIGAAAFIQPSRTATKPRRPVETHPDVLEYSYQNGPFDPWRTAHRAFNVFEPASSWVIRSEVARRIGPWDPPSAGRLNSTTQWLARAHRAGVRFSTSAEPTVAKVNLHHAHSGPVYETESEEHRLLERLLQLTGDDFRDEVAESLARRASWRTLKRNAGLRQGSFAARVRFNRYLQTGHDRWLRASAPRVGGNPLTGGHDRSRRNHRTGELPFSHPPVRALSAIEHLVRPSP